MKTLQKKFKMSKGEINPLLAERQDTSILDSSASYIKNYISTPYGGFRTRGGTTFIDRLGEAGRKTKIIPLIFSNSEQYLLVLSNEQIDVYQSNTMLTTLPATGLLEDYFDRLKYTQTEDRLILTHPNMRTKEVVKAEGSVSIIPTFLVSETSRDGYTITAEGFHNTISYDLDTEVYKSFDSNDSTFLDFGLPPDTVGGFTTIIDCTFDTTKTITEVGVLFDRSTNIYLYKLVGGTYTLVENRQFKTSSTAPLVPLTRTTFEIPSESWDGVRIQSTGDIVVPTFYPGRIYDISASETSSASLDVNDFVFKNIPKYAFDGETSTGQTIGITPSAEEGNITITAASSVFLPEHEGQYIDLAVGTRVKITEYISSIKVSGYTVIPFVDATTITSWFLITGYTDVWSTEKGYPNSCLFYQQRLWFGGSKSRPSSVWASRIDQISDFGNLGSYDNDGIDITISGTSVGEIVNLSGNRGLQILTDKAEYISPENSLTPNSITVIETTSKGSSSKVNPATINGITMFIDSNENSLLDFVYTEEQGAYTTREGAILNSHLIVAPVVMGVDNNSNLGEGNYLNMVMSNGEMVTTCTLLEQKINAFVRFITEGNITDVANLGSDTYITVNRENGLYLEQLTSSKIDNTQIVASASTITGLTDFANETVRVYSNTENYSTFPVDASGELIFTPGDVGDVFVGYDIECQLISNKMQVNGQTSNIYTRISKTAIVTNDTDKVKLNKSTKATKDGIVRFFTTSGWKRDNKFTIESTFDYLEILSIVLNLNYGRG